MSRDLPIEAEWMARINSASLKRAGIPTVVLVVFNFENVMMLPGRVHFTASFPISGPKPVAVWDNHGNAIPSRIISQYVDPEAPDLSPGRVLWTLTLEFALADGLPAHSARAYAASYEDVTIPDEFAILESLPLLLLPVYETDCHAGDLGTEFAL